ncbi:MAG: phosphatase PAP2 family protein [Candidatus Eisenbacteria bacterium]|nr:phosphatase PAP2 family protein [Candidatus Eisenbacteria bacterium]
MSDAKEWHGKTGEAVRPAFAVSHLEPADIAVGVYVLFTTAVLTIHPHSVPGAGLSLALRALVLALLALLATGRFPVRLQWLRDFYPILLTPFFYEEIGHLNRAFTVGFHDAMVVGWEHAVFGGQPSVTLRQVFPQVWLSEYLHLAYLSYYFLAPALALVLYLSRRRAEFRVYMGTMSVSFFLCMTIFIFFPVTGPFHYFVPPLPGAVGRWLPHVVHWVLRGGSSLGSAFPSSHVAVSMTVLFMAWRYSRTTFWVLLALVPALSVGAVYGGFHYAIDAVAGLALAMFVYAVVPGILERRGGMRAR